MSESIKDLAAALAKAQAEMGGASMSRTNPAFKSKYATLADVWDACRGPLTKNGLSIVQMPSYVAETGCVRITTILLHSSGQELRETLDLPVVKKDPQGIGSALTYGRRYGLSAMVGVAPDEDDDGNSASRGHDNSTRQPSRMEHASSGQRAQQRPNGASEPPRSGVKVVYKRGQGDPSDRDAP